MANRTLSDAELEWRRNLGARITQAARNADLSVAALAALLNEQVANVSQYAKGIRKLPPSTLSTIARVCGVTVEDLCADEGTPLPPPSRTGRCRERFVLEASGPGHRIALLLGCDELAHGDELGHHDPRGFRWNADDAPSSG